MNELIQSAVSRFLGWKLPTDFAPDGGITFKRHANKECCIEFQYTHEPVGTNLFNDPQAKAMLMHVAKPLIDRIAELESGNNHLRAVANTAISFLKGEEIAQLEAINNQWQPIETAPKDKDETLLGFVPHSMGGYLCPIAHSASGGWFNASCIDFSRVKPSHWKPASYPPIDVPKQEQMSLVGE